MSKYASRRACDAHPKTSGALDVGTVVFHKERQIKRMHVHERDNAVVNRLNKSRVAKDVDFEAEFQERQRAAGQLKKDHYIKHVSACSQTF